MSIFQGLGHVALRVANLDAKGEPWIVCSRIRDDLFLELFPGGAGPAPAEGTGLMHLCLTVDDMDRAEADLAKAGVPLMRPRSDGRGVDGNRGMWIEDADGHRIDTKAMVPDCIQNRAVRNLRDGGAPQALPLT